MLEMVLTGPASVGTVDMNAGLEANDMPANMDTTDDLVPTLDVIFRQLGKLDEAIG